MSLTEDGSNIKRQLEAFKNQISIADDDEKNMLFRDIDELLCSNGEYWQLVMPLPVT
jgi:hypothetical protein